MAGVDRAFYGRSIRRCGRCAPIIAAGLLTKGECNPIIRPSAMPCLYETVYNSGVARLDGHSVLLLRVGLHERRSVYGLAWSWDEFHFTVHPEIVSPEGQGL